jgi:pimeloyl-ACP methyl ester carboxylesterase
MIADLTPRQIVLTGGRRLGWYEFGDGSGAPCLFLPGSSSSGIAGRALDAPATAAGIRLISIDRPGLGRSDRAPARRLVDWPDDIAELLDQVSIDRAGVLGHSAGGAFALAVADRLADRVSATIVCAGSGPYSERWFRDEAHQTPMSRVFYGLALHAPRLFGAVLSSGTPRTAKGIDRTVGLMSRGTSPDVVFARTHPEETRASLEAVADGFRQGREGPTDDARLICSPWGFELEDVHASVEWWHGAQDGTVKPEAGEAITSRLPHATMHLVDGGHTLLFERAQEILQPVRRT